MSTYRALVLRPDEASLRRAPKCESSFFFFVTLPIVFSVPALLYRGSLDTYTHTTYDLTIPQFSWPITRDTNSDNENFSILNVESSSLGKKLRVLAKKYQPLRGTGNNVMMGVSSDSTCGRGLSMFSILTLTPPTPPPPSLYASWSVMRNLGTKHLGAIN